MGASTQVMVGQGGNLAAQIAALFAAGEKGAWFDPSDQATLFQDTAGATPVTALEQTVGRMLDKSGRGAHATQATVASRPKWSAKVNPLTYSEQFDNAAWTKNVATATIMANSSVAPDGAMTADTLTLTAAQANLYRSSWATVVGVTYTLSCYYQGTGETVCLRALTSAGATYPAASTINLVTTSTWTRYSVTWTATTTGTHLCICDSRVAGATTVGAFKIWGAQLDIGSVPTRYQRVDAAGVYDGVGFPRYLLFDGVDDSMVTAAIDMTATDKVTVWAGERKLSDAASGTMLFFGTANGSAGAFYLKAPYAAVAYYGFYLVGTATHGVTAGVYAAPNTAVVSVTADIAAPAVSEIAVRVNGATPGTLNTTAGTDAGNGNLGNHPLKLGANPGASFEYLNGNLYGLIVRGAASSAAQVAAGEAWMNSKCS